MNPERQVSDVEMRWMLETQPDGEQRLVAHWTSAEIAPAVPLAA